MQRTTRWACVKNNSAQGEGLPLWFDHELFLGEEIQVVLAAGAGIDDSGKVARKIVGVSTEGNAEGEGNF